MNVQQREEYLEELNQKVAALLGRKKLTILYDCNWSSTRSLGQCCYRPRLTIKISRYLEDNQIKNTMLHELCHAYDTKHSGHGGEWRRLAMIVGQVFHEHITRLASNEESDKFHDKSFDRAVAKFDCPCCHRTFPIYRRGWAYQSEGKGYKCGYCRTPLKFTKIR